MFCHSYSYRKVLIQAVQPHLLPQTALEYWVHWRSRLTCKGICKLNTILESAFYPKMKIINII